MIFWLCYDISDDKARRKVSILCKQAGLYRVQYSVFAGKLSIKAKKALWAGVQPYILTSDKCYLFRIGPEAFNALEQCGSPIDKAFLLGEGTVLFF